MENILVISLVVLWFISFFNIALTLSLSNKLNNKLISNRLTIRHKLQRGDKAPPFHAHTLIDKKNVTETFFSKSHTLLLFVSPYCQPCRDQMAYFKSILPKAKQQSQQVLFVSDGTYEDTQAFAQELGLERHFVVAPRINNPLLENYGIEGMPFYCFIDNHSIIQSVGHPNLNQDEWKAIVDSWETTSPKLDFVPATL